MKRLIVCFLAMPALLMAESGTAQLTLTTPDVTNKINAIKITVKPMDDSNLSSSDTAILDGFVWADFKVDVGQGLVEEMTLYNGHGSSSDLHFKKSIIFLASYDIEFTDIGFSLYSHVNPATISNIQTGEFDASQHGLTIDQGTASGSYSLLGSGDTIDIDFSPPNDVQGDGEGTGTVTLVRTGIYTDHVDYDVLLSLPVSINRLASNSGTDVRIEAQGIIQAQGQLSVPVAPYVAWTLLHDIYGAPVNDDANGDSVPNAVAWALGLNAAEDARPYLPRVQADKTLVMTLPSSGSAWKIRVLESINLKDWTAVASSRVSTGVNPLTVGSSGEITVAPPDSQSGNSSSRFYRIEVDE